jgi:hypothetical protein
MVSVLPSIIDLLKDSSVREGLRQAWLDSSTGVFGGHEEGGFILMDERDALSIARWPRGVKNLIDVPPHPLAHYEGKRILATFHTYPNTGRSFDPEPSDGDVDGVRFDKELKVSHYCGELVISEAKIYHILPYGDWYALTETRILFDGSNDD